MIAAPIWAQGPSLPTEPPKASVSTVASSFTGATFQSTLPDAWWTAAMTASVPWPRADGAKVRISQTQAGRARGRSQYGGRPRVRSETRREEASSDHRKARVASPTHTPATPPSSAHLVVLMRRAVCSVYQRASSARCGGSGSFGGPAASVDAVSPIAWKA